MQKKKFCTHAAREYCKVPARAARISYFLTISYQMANPEFSHFLPKNFSISKLVVFWIALLVNSDGSSAQNLGFG